MIRGFTVEARHSNHAGQAHLSIRHPDGTQIVLRDVPFEHRTPDSLTDEQHRILLTAARLLRQAADVLDTHEPGAGDLPTHGTTPGASPQADEAPNRHGQPLPPT